MSAQRTCRCADRSGRFPSPIATFSTAISVQFTVAGTSSDSARQTHWPATARAHKCFGLRGINSCVKLHSFCAPVTQIRGVHDGDGGGGGGGRLETDGALRDHFRPLVGVRMLARARRGHELLGDDPNDCRKFMDSPVCSFKPNLQGADIVAAGERSFDCLQDRSKMRFCWHRCATRW
jgi:hypothetical protein